VPIRDPASDVPVRSSEPLPSVVDVVEELRDVFDDLELALWFVSPNAWLGHAAPVDLVNRDDETMLQAARADRFVAWG
jgi:hypothetical protein